MNIELWPLSRIKPYPGNPRVNDSAVDSVMKSIQEFGFRQPIVVDEHNVIVVGHTRYKAAQKLGLETVPVHMASGLSAEQIRAYRIADNQTATLADWDLELLPLELMGLQEAGFDLNLLGFTAAELTSYLASEPEAGLTDPDDVPLPPDEAITQPGDLIVLGDHRLLCGDSRCADDVSRLLDGHQPTCVVTDPPYGVGYIGKTCKALPVHNDEAEMLLPLLREAFQHAFDHSVAGAVWYVCAPAGPQFYAFATVLKDLEVWRQTLVWAKQSLVMGHSDYHYQHEAIFYGWKPGAPHRPPPDRKQNTLWQFDRPSASRDHPTMKPVSLFLKMLQNSTVMGSLVYDPFCGSGTSLMAAEQLGRVCYGIEISPQYCDVVVQRWEQFTGQTAERIGQTVAT
jgi:DNA modification methylase